LRQSTLRPKKVPTGDSSRRLTNDRATGRTEAQLIGPSSAASLAESLLGIPWTDCDGNHHSPTPRIRDAMTSPVRCADRLAIACDECRRALALVDRGTGFGGIARHPEQGTDCRVCNRGAAEPCVECLCESVLELRAEPDGPYAPLSLDDFAKNAEHWADWRDLSP
jgi:hypothetical protein